MERVYKAMATISEDKDGNIVSIEVPVETYTITHWDSTSTHGVFPQQNTSMKRKPRIDCTATRNVYPAAAE